jgi:hypothetical protein
VDLDSVGVTMNQLQREHMFIHGKFYFACFGCSAARLIIYSTTRNFSSTDPIEARILELIGSIHIRILVAYKSGD